MSALAPTSSRAVLSRRSFIALSGGALAATSLLATASARADQSAAGDPSALAFDASAWNYDADNDVYWQIGVVYCASPAATDYESLGIYVPGAYLDATQNDDGTYTCTPSATGQIGEYTALTAPIVMPVNTAGYSAQAAPTSYSYNGLGDYLSAGFVYAYAGCRGRNNATNPDGTSFAGGAPWGVTDLKAAVRYLRANTASIPGDTDRIFSFGHSGGGAQSALLGATGDAALYTDYLASIGAATSDASGNSIGDAICGSMCWCPITSLDIADCAYEWMMGQFSSEGTRAEGTFTHELLLDLAASFADYVNAMGLCDVSGSPLTLEASGSGIYLAGSYYNNLLTTIEDSLNAFLVNTAFPYASGASTMADGGFAGAGAGASAGAGAGTGPDGAGGEAPADLPSETGGGAPADLSADAGDAAGGEALDAGGAPNGAGTPADNMGGKGGPDATSEQVTYETVQDYIDALNASETWVSYDEATNTASVLDLGGFVRACKQPSKTVGAFDALDRSQAENCVFGCSASDALHFDARMADFLSANAQAYAAYADWNEAYPSDYADDQEILDDLGNDSAYRQNTYNPLYFTSPAHEGYGSATPARHWRIRTGIEQGDTALTTELDLALALAACDGVDDVDFATVWGQGHTTAEVTGDSTANFISWVNDCCAAE